jgi:ABC-2 type transport system ATP-binding protein
LPAVGTGSSPARHGATTPVAHCVLLQRIALGPEVTLAHGRSGRWRTGGRRRREWGGLRRAKADFGRWLLRVAAVAASLPTTAKQRWPGHSMTIRPFAHTSHASPSTPHGPLIAGLSSTKGFPMLAIRNLSKTYANGVKALDDVSLDIPRGMFGLLGPNGAGKSSLMRTLATLQEADAGSATLEGADGSRIDVLRDKDAVRRQLGYLPQDFGVYPKVSAEDLLAHFAVLKGLSERKARREQVEALLQQVNLWDARKRKLGTFSGGMRQRFGIAQALLGSPRLVIVDEPTAGLDPEERNRFLNLLAEISENVAVILSTHIVEDVTDLCPTMAIMDKGRVLLSGRPVDAIGAMADRVWRRRVAKSELAAVTAGHAVLSTRLVGGEPVVHVYAETRPEGFERVEPGLEDVYFRQLKRTALAA